MARPVIALLTDFGLRDHYVGAMKGVALGICPDAALVDISHEIPRHDVLAAALELDASYRYFPPGTIFLVVVDPGVGSNRRGLALEAGGYRFVAPDNGVLSSVLDSMSGARIVELTDRRFARPRISRTFEGRDRFAPAAAWLACGVDIAALGRDAGPVCRLEIPKPRVEHDGLVGEVLRVDRFGNLITNIDRETLEAFATGAVVDIGGRHIPGIISTYSDAPAHGLCALIGSAERLEIAVNGASAADALGVGRGVAVHVRRGA